MDSLKKNKILAEGEATGHAHRAAAEDAYVLENELFCPTGTDVTHEEHTTLWIPPGQYDISQQREVDPDTEEIRKVSD